MSRDLSTIPEGTSRAETILLRLQALEGVKTDAALTAALRASGATISAWRKRGSVPLERLAEYAREKGVSLEWLVNGRGPVHLRELAVAEPGAIYRVETDQDAVYRIAALVTAYCLEHGIHLAEQKIESIVKLIHRDMLAAGISEVSRQRVEELIHLAQ